jgi:hypothetical protein
MEEIGKWMVSIGGVLVLGGLCLWLFGNQLGWLGHLPGDVKIDRPGFSLYMPITSMLLISIGLSFIIWAIGKLNQ